MKRFFLSLTLCFVCLVLIALVMAPKSVAKDDLVTGLLNLPAPPPPNPLVDLRAMSRPEGFFDPANPPGDDAPIDDLMEYWQHQGQGYRDQEYTVYPSERTINRILAELEKEPSRLGSYLSVFTRSKKAVDFVKAVYDRGIENDEDNSAHDYKRWLTYNSPYFSSTLERSAQRVADSAEYVTNQDELLAMSRVDWQGARPIVDRLYAGGEKVSRVLAQWALYANAIESGTTSDIDRYRDELKAVVEDKTATDGMRDLAFDALSREKEWPGRDEWYFSLFEDETLDDLTVNGSIYTGLTTLVMFSPPGKYDDKMIELVKSDNKNVRTAAAKNLLLSLSSNYPAVSVRKTNPAVVKALLPWLSDPKWINGNPEARSSIVSALQTVKLPESVPALIAALDEKGTRDEIPRYYGNMNAAANAVASAANAVASAANAMSNVAVNRAYTVSNSNSNTTKGPVEIYYPLRQTAINALANQGDVRAAPALRRILPQVEGHLQGMVVGAIYKCNGYTVLEQADGVEAAADKAQASMAEVRAIAAAANLSMDDPQLAQHLVPYFSSRYANAANTVSNMVRNVPSAAPDPEYLKEQLGQVVLQSRDASDALIRELIQRIDRYEKTDPARAEMLRRMMVNFNGPAVNALLLRDLRNGRSDLSAVIKLLTLRKELREKQQPDVVELRSGDAAGVGISACLLESDSDYEKILAGENAEAKAAMLGCARMIRAKLPIDGVAKYLSGTDKRLAVAAEKYLESEDSPKARAIVLSLHPNEAKILGATTAFWPEVKRNAGVELRDLMASVNPAFLYGLGFEVYSGQTHRFESEKELRDEVKENAELVGIYAYAEDFIRIFKDKAVYSWTEDEARYRERTLTKEEFDDIKDYLAEHNAADLPPFLGCSSYCTSGRQILMVGKQGGRRVFSLASRTPKFFAGLDEIFAGLRLGGGKIRYNLERDVPGLEVLFADDNKSAETVWKNGGDFRLLVTDKIAEKRIERELEAAAEEMEAEAPVDEDEYILDQKISKLRDKRAYESYTWFNFGGSRLGDAVMQPLGIGVVPVRDGHAVEATSEQWKARTAAIEVRGNQQGLHVINGGKLTKIRSGHYEDPIITSNGKWAVVTKFDEGDNRVVRINLLTKREFQVGSAEETYTHAVAFVPSMNRVLVTSSYSDNIYGHHVDPGSFSWLDPETGKLLPVKGEVRPLAQQSFRPLQSTAVPNEFWAAIPDTEKRSTSVGTYDSRTLAFRPLLKIPKIVFGSMDMWVDTGKIYFVYNGHLLALPIPAAVKR